ncbi:hypothetical protein [Allochromatium tepidum]|uniref:Type I-F CRISPR-associated helicase Cas3 n=1 Tax=Allochromatium tepidum TaxID=553982 RepID=A0ABN6GFQ4_9GAMM|nr:hypothetical protein [Allochromatium tepidum]BCU08479.1 type I-F CRISPR-associated helicase Cas3 [Allochromatium tepidum]
MYITLISACEKRALKRTRAVLDSYALRIGDRAWQTLITLEGLQEMRALLRRTATRQTAVACYRHYGNRNAKLLWVVGSRRPFGPTGHYPAGTQTRRRRETPLWIRASCLLAQAGGLGHDWGKSGDIFANKLAAAVKPSSKAAKAAPVRDAVRHEWISMGLLQKLHQGQDLEAAWAALQSHTRLCEVPLPYRMRDGQEALHYIVGTHHKLFGPIDAPNFKPNSDQHVREKLGKTVNPVAALPEPLINEARKLMGRLNTLVGPEASPDFWRGLSTFSRVALILADHEVSSREGPTPSAKNAPYAMQPAVWANTDSVNGQIVYKQPLGWHLHEVSRVAADRAYQIATLRLPGLSGETVERILSPSHPDGPFAWQNPAREAARQLAERDPVLVLNIAATGSGKTKMNLQMACALNPRSRVAIALNLRTLTLQTGAALRAFGIGDDEMAVVIGDQVTKKLHDWQMTTTFDVPDDDDPNATPDYEYVSIGGEVELPSWMDHVLKKRPRWRSVLSAPVLVSTIDFLINAGEPGRQGNHVAALLRLIDSDLILDEIDSYDPEPLVAVLRLIQMAGLCRRNVICSSATLAAPVAHAIQKAFMSGLKMRAALEQREINPVILLVNDQVPPMTVTLAPSQDFHSIYKDYTQRLVDALPKRVCRWAYLQRIANRSLDSWLTGILHAVERLHHEHSWVFKGSGKRVSFGLVRIANISTAIRVADFLSNRLPHARIACYHSQEIIVQRFHKERRLDWLLTRKPDLGNKRIEDDVEINQIIDLAAENDVPFIVVATPVEEVGRDHDFDWGILEPSSTHALIQPGGRINRHRNQPVQQPNIAILQFNARYAKKETVVFCKPGLQKKSNDYTSLDLAELLDWDNLKSLDSRIRFGGNHVMAQCDDKLLMEQLKNPLSVICSEGGYSGSWMTEGFYRKYSLRPSDQFLEDWQMQVNSDGHESFYWYKVTREGKKDMTRRDIDTIPRKHNDWLVLSPIEMKMMCDEVGISPDDGLSFKVRMKDITQKPKWHQSFGFLSET